MSFLDRYKTDPNLEENGVWVPFGDGVEFLLARFTSKKSKAVRRELEKPYLRQIRSDSLSPEIQDEITIKQMAEAIVLGWKGVPDPDNESKELKFSKENVVKLLTRFPDLKDDLAQAALERSTFKAIDMEEAKGNS